MVLSKIWSQGQIFAFSALDGRSLHTDDFVGTLCGDRLGIIFYSKTKRELCFKYSSKDFKDFFAVTSDYIEVINKDDSRIKIVYANTHLIIGSFSSSCKPIVMVEGKHNFIIKDGVEIQDTFDGQFTGIKIVDNMFCFAFSDNVDDLIKTVNGGFDLEVDSEIAKKCELYKTFSLKESNEFAPLYAKCLSTMKTQLYTPESMFTKTWSTPDRLPHKFLWLWDSVFHGIGHSNYNSKIGEELILSLFDTQREDGFIPHLSTPKWQSDITQPPIIAWGANIVYQRSENKEFLKVVYQGNKKFLKWCQANRRDTDEELYTWLTGDDENCRCDESGMDNSPRFDKHTRLQAIDYSCFMANDVRNMANIAQELGLYDEADEYKNWYERIKKEINRKLWDEDDGFYYDYDLPNNTLHKVSSVASFLPLFAGVCDDRQAGILVEHLLNPDEYFTEFPIPSISKKDATFGSDMWRGPVWINYNYMISKGLFEYNFKQLSDYIIDKTISVLNEWYFKRGVMFEFYDSENKKAPCELNRKGPPVEPYNFEIRMQSIRDYGWSNTLLFDMLHNKYFINK